MSCFIFQFHCIHTVCCLSFTVQVWHQAYVWTHENSVLPNFQSCLYQNGEYHGSSWWTLGCLDILEKTKHVVLEVHNNDGNNSHLSYCNVKDRKAYQIITHWSNMKWRSNQSYHQTILKIDYYVCPNRARVPNGLSISPRCHSSPHNIWCMLYIFGIAIYFSRSMNPIDCKVCMLIIIWLLVCTTKI